jgi:hypothetical protein
MNATDARLSKRISALLNSGIACFQGSLPPSYIDRFYFQTYSNGFEMALV